MKQTPGGTEVVSTAGECDGECPSSIYTGWMDCRFLLGGLVTEIRGHELTRFFFGGGGGAKIKQCNGIVIEGI